MSLFYKLTKKRLYSSTKKHMDGITVSVNQERFASADGVNDIPHQIVTAMSVSRDWLEHAISMLTVGEYRKGERLAKVYLHVYRKFIAPPALRQGQDKLDKEQEKKMDTAIKDDLARIAQTLRNIKIGLGKDQVIKVNDSFLTDKSGRPELDENGQKRHYLGVVKNVKTGARNDWGAITIGYKTFRERHNLARVLIHEAAHKYDSANDGPANRGYWASDFSDYLKPDIDYTSCRNNADSHALFVWALNVERTGIQISDEFEANLENRWTAQNA